MFKNVAKFFGVAMGMGVLGVAILFAIEYWQYQNSPEYQVTQDLKELERKYAEDPYGGDTPEETLRLFIDALKNDDLDLAARYFVLDKQTQWKDDLEKIKEKGLLDEMVRDVERAKKSKEEPGVTFYTVANEENVVTVLIDLRKGPNGIWKILDL